MTDAKAKRRPRRYMKCYSGQCSHKAKRLHTPIQLNYRLCNSWSSRAFECATCGAIHFVRSASWCKAREFADRETQRMLGMPFDEARRRQALGQFEGTLAEARLSLMDRWLGELLG